MKINKTAFLVGLGLVLVAGIPWLAAAEQGSANTQWTKKAEEAKAKMEARQAERAEAREARQEERQADRQERFCSRFAETTSNISERLQERQAKIGERVTTRETRWTERTEKRDGKLEDKRAEQDARRAELYKKLEDEAGTDAEKVAVLAFKKAMDEAVAKRRAAVDAAMKAFRDGVNAALAAKKTSAQSVMGTFQSAVDAAVAQAKSQCEGGTDPATVRSNFRDGMQAARDKLQNDRSERERLGQKIRELVKVRQDAFAKALADFKTAAEKARADLKAVLGDDAEEVEEPTTETAPAS